MSAKGKSPAASMGKPAAAPPMRTDPYSRLLSDKSTIRIEAAVTLVQDLHRILEKESTMDPTEIKRAPNGLSLNLEYPLQRLIAGLESTDRYATIGFSTALAMFLSHFSPTHIKPEVFEAMVMRRHGNISYGGLSNKEQQSFDLGSLFLIQTLERVNLLSTMSPKFVEKLLIAVTRLANKNPQMNDLCVGTIIKLTEQCSKSSSRHFQSILTTLTNFIPKPSATDDKSNIANNKYVPLELARWDAGTINAALALRRLNHTESFDQLFPGFFTDKATFQTIWALLVPTLPAYPIIPTVWVQLLTDALTIPGHFQAFFNEIIVPNLADEYSYNKRGIAMTIVTDFVQSLITQDPQQQPSTTTLQSIITTLFSVPSMVKTVMDHARMPGTPLYMQSITLLGTMENFCSTYKPLIPTIISIFSDPSKGGSRSFDGKSKTKFVANMAALLDKDMLLDYISTTITTFHNAEATIEADIRHVAQLTKQRQEDVENMMGDEENDKKGQQQKKNGKNEDKNTIVDAEDAIKSSLSKTDLSKITDVDEFMKTDIAKRTLQQAVGALQLWTVDQVFHLCELLFKLQRNLQHTAAKQRQESKQSKVEEVKPKGKKGKNDKNQEESDEFSVDSAQMEQCLQNCLTFLYTHAFYKSNPSATDKVSDEKNSDKGVAKKGKKTTKKVEDLGDITIQPVSLRCREICSQRFISLFTTLLLADGHYHPHGALSLKFGAQETRWGAFVVDVDQKLREQYNFIPTTPITTLDQVTKSQSDAVSTLAIINDWCEKMMVKYKKDGDEIKGGNNDQKLVEGVKFSKTYLDLATMLKYVITTTFALLQSDVEVLAPVVSDLRIITYGIQQDYLKNAPRGTKLSSTISLTEDELEMLEDDDESPWVDVLLDLLLSVIGLGHNVTRNVVLKSFQVLVPHLKMSSITLLIDPIAQAVDDMEDDAEDNGKGKKGGKEKGQTMGDDDDFIDFDTDSDDNDSGSDFSDMTDDENEELGDVIRQFAKDGITIDVDAEMGDDDDGNFSEEEIDAFTTADILLDKKSSLISPEQQDAIQGIIRLQKEQHRAQKNKVEAAMLMKIRILDLVEVLITEMFATNTWLSLLLPMIVMIKNTRNQALGALQTKAINLFKTKLCSTTTTTAHMLSQRQTLSLTDADHFSNYISIDDQVINAETLIQPQDLAHGDNIQAILEAIFDSLSTTTTPLDTTTAPKPNTIEKGATMDRTTMAGYALAAVASLYLIAPAGPIEYSSVVPTAAKKSTTKGKKSPTTTGAALDKAEIQTKIYQNRVNFFTRGFLPLIQLQFLNTKREIFSASFFKLICEAPVVAGAYMWKKIEQKKGQGEISVFNVLDSAVSTSQTPFLRKQASETLSLIFKHYRYAVLLNDKQGLYEMVGEYYVSVEKQYQESLVSLTQAQSTPSQPQSEKTSTQPGQNKQPKKAGNKGLKTQREALIAAAKANKLSLQSLLERARSLVINLESVLKITKSIIPSKKAGKKEEKKEATPVKAKQQTPVKAKEATPIKAKEATPIKAKEATPVKSVATPTKATPKKAAAREEVVEVKIKATKTTAKKITMVDSDREEIIDDSDDDIFDDIVAEPKSKTKGKKAAVAVVEETEMNDEETVVAPKKRGRPAKSIAVGVAESIIAEPEPETKPTSTPRKRKTPPQPQEDDEVEDAAAAALSTPRRSTRLRK